MRVKEIIDLLKATSGTLDKRQILRDNKDDFEFQKVLTYALDPRITFGIKKVPACKNEGKQLLGWGIKQLDKLVNREATGKLATAHLQYILENMSDDNVQIIKWIIAKDFKAGFGVSLINDEMDPFSVYEVPYMGAVSYSKKRVDGYFTNDDKAFSEVKMDGRYLNVKVTDEVFMESRGGNPNPLMGALETEAKAVREAFGFDVVLNGELIMKSVLTGDMDRYTSNGIISSFVSISQKQFDGVDTTKEEAKFIKQRGMSINDVKNDITLIVWDYIPLENYKEKVYKVERLNRLTLLKEILEETKSFQLIEYKIVSSSAEALTHFQEMLARGEEGTILKRVDGIWKDGKPTHQVKMKRFDNYDLIITGFNYGKPGTKNENVISSLNVETLCGKLKTSPGGIKEADMKYITNNMNSLLGSIVEIKSCGVSHDSEGNYSMLHPVFIKLRDDKKTPTSFEQCLEISGCEL